MILTMTQCTCDSVSQDATLPGFYENPAAFLLLSHGYLTLPLQTALHFSQPSRGQGGSDFAVLPVHLRRRSVTTLRSRSVGEPHPSGWDLSPGPWDLFLISYSLCRAEGHADSGRLAGECASGRIQGWCGPTDHSYR